MRKFPSSADIKRDNGIRYAIWHPDTGQWELDQCGQIMLFEDVSGACDISYSKSDRIVALRLCMRLAGKHAQQKTRREQAEWNKW